MDAHDFVTVSTRRNIALGPADSPPETVRRILVHLVGMLREGGCAMAGHIKGMLEDGESQPLFFSLTSLDGEAQLKGGPLEVKPFLSLSINVIIAGIAQDEASRLLDLALDRYDGKG